MKTVKIAGVPEHFNLPWHLCIENGEFEEENIDLPNGKKTSKGKWQKCSDVTVEGGKPILLVIYYMEGNLIIYLGGGGGGGGGRKSEQNRALFAIPLISLSFWGIHVAKHNQVSKLRI
ncbi:hypothetical protein ACFFWB_27375 [Flavobacterium procerum]|uniref:hypothetical protein n=1 Tax=Flavobacterium procerum TaxID=1455569 RepID=UPI0035F040C8